MSAPPACGFYPSSLTDAQWAIIEPLLPAPGNTAGRGGRPEEQSRRLVLDAIFYLVRGGIAWRHLPVGFPPPTTVYDRFRAWAKAGVWQAVHDALRDLVRVYEGGAPSGYGKDVPSCAGPKWTLLKRQMCATNAERSGDGQRMAARLAVWHNALNWPTEHSLFR